MYHIEAHGNYGQPLLREQPYQAAPCRGRVRQHRHTRRISSSDILHLNTAGVMEQIGTRGTLHFSAAECKSWGWHTSFGHEIMAN